MKRLILTLTLLVSTAGCGELSLPGGKSFPNNPALTQKDSGILGTDKGLHFLAGMGTATVTRAIVQQTTTWNRKEQMIAGCAAAAVVGVGKELYDRDVMGTRFETADAIYTAAGCLATFEWAF